jgi:hypothetical protein
VQLVCDGRGLIRYYIVGWPGSCYDSTVLDQSAMGLNPERYFALAEWMLADSGYTLKWWMCTPYKKPAALIPVNDLFNHLFSSCRVLIEHVNGILKNRFASLKGVRVEVKKKQDFQKVNEWIVVCIILHNFLKMRNDEWADDDDEQADEDEAPWDYADADAGRDLRQSVQDYLLNHFANMTI